MKKKWLLGLFLIILCSFVSANYINDMNGNILGYYPLEDIASPINNTVSATDGTCTNCPDFSQAGKINNGMNFVAASTERIDLNFVTGASSNKSWGGWFSPDLNNGMLVSDADFVVAAWVGVLSAAGAANKYSCGVYAGALYYATSTTSFTGGGTYDHVVCTMNSSNIKIYVNGVLEDTTAVAGAYTLNGRAVCIADRCSAVNMYYDGLADEVFFYDNYTLNQIHIDFLYNLGSPDSDQQYIFSSNDFSTTLSYPTNETTYYGTYTGEIINISLNNINGSALCTLNDTRWSFNSNDNTTYSFINNTAIIGSNITLFYNCTDTSGQQSNDSFWFYLDTILDITFYDESTLTKLNTTNITFQLISDLSGTNYTTDDGNYSLFTLPPGDYEINYFGDNYVNRQYYLTIIEGKKTTVSLYLINSTEGQQIIATLYDTYGNELPNYYIKTYRRINGVYYLVETSYTNSDGETDFYAILNTPMYYWQIWGIDDILYKQTTETEIYSTNLDYVISLTSPIGHIFNQVSGYLYSFTFDNTTNKWTYIFTDTTSLSTYNKLAVYDAKKGTLIASNGTISTSGTLVVDMNPYYVNGSSYIAKITANASPEYSIDSKYYTYFTTPYQVGLYGVFMTIIIVLLLTLIAFWNPAVMFIMQAFAIMITWMVGLHELSLTSVTTISAILIIFAYIVSDRT